MTRFSKHIRNSLRLFFARRGILLLAGVFICIYGVAVLLYSQSIPQFELRTTFSTILSSQPQQFHSDETSPRKGDRIEKIGHVPIDNWVDLLKAPFLIQEKLKEKQKPSWVKISPEDGKTALIPIRFSREGVDKPIVNYWPLGQPTIDEFIPSMLWFSVKIMIFLLGGLILWRRPNDPVVAQFFLLCIVTFGAYMGGYHWISLTTQSLLMLVFMVCAVMLPAVNLHFYLLFPRKKTFLVRHPRWTMAVLYGIPLLFLLALASLYLRMRWLGGMSVDAELNLIRSISYTYMGIATVSYGICIACLLHSFVAAKDQLEKNQVKWILIGFLAAAVPISYSLYVAFFAPDAFNRGAATWPMFSATIVLTAAFAVSITRYRLMDLDVIITSGFGYFLISFLAGLLYYTVVFVGTLISNQVIAGPNLFDALTVSGTALVLLFVLDFVRSRFKSALDKRFYRDKSQLDKTLQKLGQAIEQLVDPRVLGKRLLTAASDMLGVANGGVYLADGDLRDYRLQGRIGNDPMPVSFHRDRALIQELKRGRVVKLPENSLHSLNAAEQELKKNHGVAAVPLQHEDRLLAFLILGAKPTSYQKSDVALLAALGQITGLALRNAEGHRTIDTLNQDLQDKVEKISEQQRRILALQSQLRKQQISVDDDGEPVTARDRTRNGNAVAHGPGGIIGSSPTIGKLLQLVEKVAATDAVVLIRGESGTGKELLAQAVHDTSNRAGKAFVKVHCAALSPTLLESELFGHVKGAFTGAHRDKVGRFELANGGTLFLDEIGDISLDVQTKLLRVLQEQIFERVGSSEPLKVDVRIVAATHQNLEDLIQQGRFREDLFYRINVFPLYVPPLRERPEDITELCDQFIQVASARCGKAPLQLDDDVLSLFKTYSWPGNIRQLENVIERAVVIAEDDTITTDDVPNELFTVPKGNSVRFDPAPIVGRAVVYKGRGRKAHRAERERLEQEQLQQALTAADGNKAEAARLLGLARSTLVSRMKKYGMN